jgi:hypothetical protein
VSETPPPTVFLSSLYKGLVSVRDEIRRTAEQLGVCLRLANAEAAAIAAVTDHLELADALIRAVRESDALIVIVGPVEHGSRIVVSGIETNVSFLEVEVFEAALLQKPVRILVHEAFAPSARLAGLLALLRDYVPPAAMTERLSEAAIVAEAGRYLERIAKERQQATKGAIRRLTASLFSGRGAPRERYEPERDVRFLGGLTDHADRPDTDVVDRLLADAKAHANHVERLARVWIALRELRSSLRFR